MKYTIRYYTDQDKDAFKSFMDEYWCRNHILTKSDVIFDFQYKMDDKYTMVLAINNQTNEIDALMGYIHNFKYDTLHQVPKIVWGAVWQNRDEGNKAGLGMALQRFIVREESGCIFATSGISDIARNFYTLMGYDVGRLTHFYIANPNIDTFEIALNPFVKNADPDENICLRYISLEECNSLDNSLNFCKNVTYLVNRYQKHPVYDYRFVGVYNNIGLQLVLVIRKQRMGASCCLRIVDMIGNANFNQSILYALQKLLKRENAEYIDCLNHGIAQSFFENLGFKVVTDGVIIPDYFAPFEKRNIEIGYVSMKVEKPIIIFKGDCDQDRPNKEEFEPFDD